MPDHFYTTDRNGELALQLGYGIEGVTGHVFGSQEADTVPIYRFFHSGKGIHFYCQDSNGELAPALGYTKEGTAWYMYADPTPDTIPLYRFQGPNDHFYTTDAEGELALMFGYIREGILGYLYPSARGNSIPLYRWLAGLGKYKNSEYHVDGYMLRCQILDQKNNVMRESVLDLSKCLEFTPMFSRLGAIDVPGDWDTVLEWKTAERNLKVLMEGGDCDISIRDRSTIHIRNVTKGVFGRNIYDADCDISSRLRRTVDGHIEFVHDFYQGDSSTGFWARVRDVIAFINAGEEDPVGDAIKETQQMTKGALARDYEFDVEDFLENTYRQGDKVIRRGS